MNGYECIRNMPDPKISKAFGVGMLEAVAMRNSNPESLAWNGAVCQEMLGMEGPCREMDFPCTECRRGFLENEVPM